MKTCVARISLCAHLWTTGSAFGPSLRRDSGEESGLSTDLFGRSATSPFSFLQVQQRRPTLHSSLSTNESDKTEEVNLVLFGVGDLRTDDHVGLAKALQATDRPTVALCVLDSSSLRNIPGAVAHTADTAQLLIAALGDLSKALKDQYNLPLHVAVPDADWSLADFLEDLTKKESVLSAAGAIRVHVHDLGHADNQMGYGPYAQLHEVDSDRLILDTWTSDLRDKPWQQVSALSTVYSDYRDRYASEEPKEPIDTSKGSVQAIQLDSSSLLWDENSGAKLLSHMTMLLGLDADRVHAETNTGMYMSHWGGLDPTSVGCQSALQMIEAYLGEVRSDDAAFTRHPLYPGSSCQRNGRSLEHASMQWQLGGKGEDDAGNMEQWLKGEALTRWASAPLLFGTLSPRRLWRTAKLYESPQFLFAHSAQTLVEGREWHRLLAARNVLVEETYQVASPAKTKYQYWRYHGFLCRYAVTDMKAETGSAKEGIILVHGFGASGAQWNKVMDALSSDADEETVFLQGLAPDLLGFGESEKPAVSYTAYMWDSMVGDFIKERAMAMHSLQSFVLGGNSIGGFTSMSAAASDFAPIPDDNALTVSSSGAPGSGRCSGLVLMNSAGPVQTKQEVEEMLQKSTSHLERASVAQITALDALSPCSPPPRPVSRAFGNVLLSYLRPNIVSDSNQPILYVPSPLTLNYAAIHLYEPVPHESSCSGRSVMRRHIARLTRPWCDQCDDGGRQASRPANRERTFEGHVSFGRITRSTRL